MKKIKLLVVVLIFAPFASLFAAGMGFHIPILLHSKATIDNGYYGNSDDEVYYTSSTGKGITFDTNIGKNRLFNYRLSLESVRLQIDEINGQKCQGDCTSTRLSMVNTFGFALIQSREIRLWIGPRFNFATNNENGSGTSTSRDNVDSYTEFSLGLATGVNFNINRAFALAVDIDYRASAGVIFEDEDDQDSDSDRIEGTTLRVYALFRFGERF